MTADHEVSYLIGLQTLDPLFYGVEPRQRLIREAQKLFARAGQRHARAQADEQLGYESLFELLDDRRQARLADLEDAGGGGKAAAARDHLKVAEMLEHAPPAW